MSKMSEKKQQLFQNKSINNVVFKKTVKQAISRDILKSIKTINRETQSQLFIIIQNKFLPFSINIKLKQKVNTNIICIVVDKKDIIINSHQNQMKLKNTAQLNKRWIKILIGQPFLLEKIQNIQGLKSLKYFCSELQYNALHPKMLYDKIDIRDTLYNFSLQVKKNIASMILQDTPYVRAIMPHRPIRISLNKLAFKSTNKKLNQTYILPNNIANTKNLQQITSCQQNQRQTMTSTAIGGKKFWENKIKNYPCSKNSRFSHEKDTTNTQKSNIMKNEQMDQQQLQLNLKSPSTLTHFQQLQRIPKKSSQNLSVYQISEHQFNIRKMKLDSQKIYRKDVPQLKIPKQEQKHESIIYDSKQQKQPIQDKLIINQSEIKQEILRCSNVQKKSQLQVSLYQDTFEQKNVKEHLDKAEQSQQLFQSVQLPSESGSLCQSKYE